MKLSLVSCRNYSILHNFTFRMDANRLRRHYKSLGPSHQAHQEVIAGATHKWSYTSGRPVLHYNLLHHIIMVPKQPGPVSDSITAHFQEASTPGPPHWSFVRWFVLFVLCPPPPPPPPSFLPSLEKAAPVRSDWWRCNFEERAPDICLFLGAWHPVGCSTSSSMMGVSMVRLQLIHCPFFHPQEAHHQGLFWWQRKTHTSFCGALPKRHAGRQAGRRKIRWCVIVYAGWLAGTSNLSESILSIGCQWLWRSQLSSSLPGRRPEDDPTAS